jgi:uncharacterized protein
MKALITGASSGMGADMARILSERGFDLILVARRKEKLERLQKELSGNTQIITMDISTTYNCMKLYDQVKKENVDILINNAGFGAFGEFNKIKLEKELDMIDLNVKSLHTLTKLFLKDFQKRDSGYILNVSSAAAFLQGPLMATYYATKAYVLKLTLAISEELKEKNSKVYIGVFCPGPVKTEFGKIANAKFNNQLESYDAANYAIKKMFKKRMIIIPGFLTKVGLFISRFLSYKFQLKTTYKYKKKTNNLL